MVFNFLRRASPPRIAAVPPGERVYAIGDVHGRLDLLDELLALIDADDAARGAATVHLILLGDLIDRGPQSREVIERVMALQRANPRVRVLQGNHEEMFLAALRGDRGEPMRFHLQNGGRETFLSYPISQDEFDAGTLSDLRTLARERVPAEHLTFLDSLEDHVVVGDYLFVHAGVRPGVPLGEQSPSDLRWIRGEFLESRRDHGHLVVHGHTITKSVDEQPNRIGIDTGAYASGVLTAIGAEGENRWFLSTAPR